MTARRNILAATDLSSPARHAVERAFRIAAATGGELYVLHAMELDALDGLRELFGADVSATKAALEARAREQLSRLTGDPAGHVGLEARTRFVTGHPVAAIAAEADALDAGLVVLGARGESFLRHAMLGSTAARLLRKSGRHPVLVVRQPPHDDYRSVLVAVDFSPASLDSVRLARWLAPGADLVLCHAFELPYEGKLSFAGVDDAVIRQYIAAGSERRRAQIHELAAAAGLAPADYVARVIHGEPTTQILAMEQEYDCDLIVLGKHGSHLAEELLLGSVTKHVLAEAQGDVLAIPDPRPAEGPLA